jgi:hypothetical protein
MRLLLRRIFKHSTQPEISVPVKFSRAKGKSAGHIIKEYIKKIPSKCMLKKGICWIIEIWINSALTQTW